MVNNQCNIIQHNELFTIGFASFELFMVPKNFPILDIIKIYYNRNSLAIPSFIKLVEFID